MKTKQTRRKKQLSDSGNIKEPDIPSEDMKAENSDVEDSVEDNKPSKAEVNNFPNVTRNRKARLIVRNLSFKTTENSLRNHFSKYGDLTEVKLLQRPDGRLVGCGFVEYDATQSAAKAIANASGQPFLNRTIVVDWAIPKNTFQQKSNVDVKEEYDGEDNLQVKEEAMDEDNLASDVKDIKDNSDEDQSSGSEGDRENEQHSENEDLDEDSEEKKYQKGQKKPKRESHDLSEGCTVFVKNLPFSADNKEFKKCMQQFGPVYYALVCIDPLTEHSKGTGFVKFRSKESAAKCLEAGTRKELMLNNNYLETHTALSREEVSGSKQKSTVKKDGRNLYLVKEGVVLPGTPAASGVSATDMAKRLKMEQWKTGMLQNLNKFVSRNRLVIHNLPPDYTDTQLRSLCLKYGGSKTVITEARVMRDNRNIAPGGERLSKEYGFVNFTSHDNALQALRALNNNPGIFQANKRPIVAFSIEDRVALNIRKKRLEKSKTMLHSNEKSNEHVSQKEWEHTQRQKKKAAKNIGTNESRAGRKNISTENRNIFATKKSLGMPNSKSDSSQETKQGQSAVSKKEKRNRKMQQLKAKLLQQPGKFMGEHAKPGVVGLMSRQKLIEHAQESDKSRKTDNKKKRTKKGLNAIKIKQPKQKLRKEIGSKTEDSFSTLVNKYKIQLTSANVERKKWYE